MKEIKNPTKKKIKKSYRKRGYALWQSDDSPKTSKLTLYAIKKAAIGGGRLLKLRMVGCAGGSTEEIKNDNGVGSTAGKFLLICE